MKRTGAGRVNVEVYFRSEVGKCVMILTPETLANHRISLPDPQHLKNLLTYNVRRTCVISSIRKFDKKVHLHEKPENFIK